MPSKLCKLPNKGNYITEKGDSFRAHIPVRPSPEYRFTQRPGVPEGGGTTKGDSVTMEVSEDRTKRGSCDWGREGKGRLC